MEKGEKVQKARVNLYFPTINQDIEIIQEKEKKTKFSIWAGKNIRKGFKKREWLLMGIKFRLRIQNKEKKIILSAFPSVVFHT